MNIKASWQPHADVNVTTTATKLISWWSKQFQFSICSVTSKQQRGYLTTLSITHQGRWAWYDVQQFHRCPFLAFCLQASDTFFLSIKYKPATVINCNTRMHANVMSVQYLTHFIELADYTILYMLFLLYVTKNIKLYIIGIRYAI